MVSAIAAVDVLDYLLASGGFDVHIDVRRTIPRWGEEPLEEQAESDSVSVRDAEGEADRRVGCRPPTLAVDVAAVTELGDVVDDEEVAGEAQEVDHVELMVDLGPSARHSLGSPRSIATSCAALDEMAEIGRLVHARWAGEARQPRRDQSQIEGALSGDADRGLQRSWPAAKSTRLLPRRTQAGRR